jgi:hypothetical protein
MGYLSVKCPGVRPQYSKFGQMNLAGFLLFGGCKMIGRKAKEKV